MARTSLAFNKPTPARPSSAGQNDGVESPTPEDIAQRAQQLKVVVLAQQLSLPAILHPTLPLLQWIQQMVGVGPNADIPLDLGDGPSEDVLRLSTREILTAASLLRGDVLGNELMTMGMLIAATQLGDMIINGGHCRSDVPLLQFARHLRNAAAHGNRWHFKSGQPEYAATCRNVTLTPDLHDQRAVSGGGIVTPRLLVLYLDDVSNHFAPGLVPPSMQVPGRADAPADDTEPAGMA